MDNHFLSDELTHRHHISKIYVSWKDTTLLRPVSVDETDVGIKAVTNYDEDEWEIAPVNIIQLKRST